MNLKWCKTGNSFPLKNSLLALCLLGITTHSNAISLLDNLGGEYGYGELAMAPNDDLSSTLLDLPFSINFFGHNYDQFYINNNGNVTFNSPLFNFTPAPFPIANQPMIAPYWADVDTRNQENIPMGANNVYVASPDENTAVVTWHDVGYYSRQNDKQNNFQLVLQRTQGTNNGSFSAEFRYDRLEWTTGSASGGSNGLGGTPAHAGYDAGDGVNFETLPGSRTNNILNLVDNSNVSEDTPGLWRYLFNDGALPGQTPENALLPLIREDGSFEFEFTPEENEVVFIDPDIAVGYDYEMIAGSNQFSSVVLPVFAEDTDGYDIYALGDTSPTGFLGSVMGGDTFDFSSPLSGFTVLGIDAATMLDPTDPTAFVTGLTFANTSTVFMTQTPITVFVDAVPEPSTYAMLLAGLVLIGLNRKKERITVS